MLRQRDWLRNPKHITTIGEQNVSSLREEKKEDGKESDERKDEKDGG